MSAPLILSFDTSAAHVAAALLSGETLVARKVEEMKRGQAERLMPMLEEILAEAGKQFADLDAIGVGIGPGNFTGIRISVSSARGLALGLGIPAVGVNSFDAVEASLEYPAAPVIPGPRGQGYIWPKGENPYLATQDELIDIMEDGALATPKADSLVEQIARLAAQRYQNTPARPAPLYIKPADAAPPKDPAPVILP
ncbi:tRNA (adenosine(37)-N6)-threonylcarbamoyltransferase complex dimerization subunit type 1 TsaB [Shimia marina]|uniref:T(6)A37 threonylcarbamoyladenosine biosynthesis protein n=1 Tax=Shimia marina TaxID=321267 RepID=A0A0N7LRK5_9RHOB|nr:tRNA (adenosine(37)-N6)-threonylcarbamoyltransferase complex dimerization subunit type 1 TsaB [Shimia marina]CUH51076.1 t(6)A37 threonylcarbamoyladenosine biosynthesis protein [Shimia marina]SFD58689.1 tRNA threonylcarbamoyl adenosine modification protein YeaZ [Shimia marina]